MHPILTVTLNPALDLSTHADAVRPGPKLRCDAPVTEPGGGGVNVARVLARLGAPVRAIVALGGPAGDSLAALLAAEGVAVEAVPAPGDTRLSLAVTDRASGAQWRFVLPGPEWTADAAAALRGRIALAAAAGSIVVLSGSQPPGVPEDFAVTLAADLGRRGARLVVDTSGAPLARLAAGPTAVEVLRLDAAEAEELAGRPLPDRAASLALAAFLVGRGVARMAVLARGAEGSVLAAAGLQVAAVPPPVPEVSKVGAGDSFTAAFVLSLARGQGAAAALAHGTAAAAAAVMTPATELCHAADVARILPQVRLEGHSPAASAR
ncbi:MAG: hexose kinase [Rhodobacteraceae bacterium]|jgi:6-phosphofructokinase 2|nr:hexose kinase [Paracoccaceae bacterium]